MDDRIAGTATGASPPRQASIPAARKESGAWNCQIRLWEKGCCLSGRCFAVDISRNSRFIVRHANWQYYRKFLSMTFGSFDALPGKRQLQRQIFNTVGQFFGFASLGNEFQVLHTTADRYFQLMRINHAGKTTFFNLSLFRFSQ